MRTLCAFNTFERKNFDLFELTAITNQILLFIVGYRNACRQTDGKYFIDAELDCDHISIDAAHQFRGIHTEFVDINVDGLTVLKLRAVFNSARPPGVSLVYIRLSP